MGSLLPIGEHDPGCATTLRLQPGVSGGAVFGGANMEYRYRLERVHTSVASPTWMMWLMMNPSGADPHVDDRTVAKCWRYARNWGYGAMWVGNVFAYRATDQKMLGKVSDPVGPKNVEHLIAMAQSSKLVVCAYGTPAVVSLRNVGWRTAQLLRRLGVPLTVLQLSQDGVPVHPLYLPSNLLPQPWEPQA